MRRRSSRTSADFRRPFCICSCLTTVAFSDGGGMAGVVDGVGEGLDGNCVCGGRNGGGFVEAAFLG